MVNFCYFGRAFDYVNVGTQYANYLLIMTFRAIGFADWLP